MDDLWPTVEPASESPNEVILPETPLRRGRTWRIVGVAAAAAVVFVISLVALSSSPQSDSASAAIVRNAVTSSLASHSMAFVVNETVTSGATSLTLDGTGACDLTAAACTASFNAHSPSIPVGQIGTIEMVYDGTTFYMKLGGLAGSAFKTPWVSFAMPVTQLQGSGSSSPVNPLASIAALARAGAKVSDLGASTVNGQSAHSYQVNISSHQLATLFKNKTAKLPRWLRSALTKHVMSGGTVTEIVAVNAAGHLCQIQMNIVKTVSGQPLNLHLTETITAYGVPVFITIPPASEVTSISSLLNSQLGH